MDGASEGPRHDGAAGNKAAWMGVRRGLNYSTASESARARRERERRKVGAKESEREYECACARVEVRSVRA
eukprot:4358733-Pleurochrysis_carterae.AAC.1